MSQTDLKYDVQIDIETFSQKKTAAVASIGAVKFTDKEILDTFSININPRSCKEAGLHFDIQTIEWWKQQKPEAYKSLKNNRVSLQTALTEFSTWYGPKSTGTWACGPDFDLVILENAYNMCNITAPWKYYDARCFRTFKAIFPSKIVRQGIYHDARDDAIYQTNYILDVLNK